MATKTFWHYDTSVSGYGKLDEGSAPSAANTATQGSYNLGFQASGQLSAQDPVSYGSNVPILGANQAAAPNGSNGFRTLNPITNSVDAGTWALTMEIVVISPSGSGSPPAQMAFTFRIYKSANADGSGATEITSGVVTTSSINASASAGTVTGTTPSLSAVSLSNEYLFITLAYKTTCSANEFQASGTLTVRVGSTKVTTPNFPSTFNESLTESRTASDSFTTQQVFACPLTETPIISWGTSGFHWGWVDGVWGAPTAIEWGSTAIYNVPLSEARTATDALVAGNIMPVSLTEIGVATDSYAPNLVLEKTLAESVTPGDSLTAQITFSAILLETLIDYWGTPGILWGASTGNWGNQALDSLSAKQVFAQPFLESVTAADSMVGNAVFPNTLLETAVPTDVYVPNLVLTVALTEVGSATESLTANNVMVGILAEPLTNYWGSSGILWDLTTGTWGGDVMDSLSSQMVFNPTLTETVSAADSLIAIQVFVSSLSEPITASDSYIPNLVITQSLLEAGGAIDLLSAQQIFSNFLVEFVTARDDFSFGLIGSTAVTVVKDPSFSIFGVESIEDPLGVDIFCFPDLDPLGILVSGFTALAQRIARRLTNSRGAWFWAPNEATDTRQYLNDIITKERLAVIQNDIEREVLREEAVKTVTATTKFDFETSQLNITLVGVTSEGPFTFVFDVTSSKLTILN